MNSKLSPALIGGAFGGVLSVLPFVGFGNVCCCLWVVCGGFLAAYVLQQNQPAPITTADGALVGLFAGLIGAVISTVLTPLTAGFQQRTALAFLEWFTTAAGEAPPQLEQALENMRSSPAWSPLGLLWNFLGMAIIGSIFSLLGGILGAAVFRRNAPPQPPAGVPPPPVPPFAGTGLPPSETPRA